MRWTATADKARDVGRMVKDGVRGVAESTSGALRTAGAKIEEGLEGIWRYVARHGCSIACKLDNLIAKYGLDTLKGIGKRAADRLQEGLTAFIARQQRHILDRHSPHVPHPSKGLPLFPDHWSNQRILDVAAEVADYGDIVEGAGYAGRTVKEMSVEGYRIWSVIDPVKGIWTSFVRR